MEVDTITFKVEQLIKEVEVDYSSIHGPIGDALAGIEQTLNNIPEQKVDASLAPNFVRDIGASADKVEFVFKRPETFQIVGSYAIEGGVKPITNIDVLIRMPKVCFREKDFLDHRYHAKRCLYLAVIARHLKSCKVVRKVEWTSFQNEARKPILTIHSAVGYGPASQFLIRIIPTATNVFAFSKLSLTRNNLRATNQDSQSSPIYNHSILEDMLLENIAGFVKNIFLGQRNLVQALVLLKVCSRNRSSMYVHDSLNGFLLSVILAYLTTEASGTRVKMSMKPLEIFLVTLDFLATSKLMDKVLFLQSKSQLNVSEERLKKYTEMFGTVLLDSSGFNLAFRMTKSGIFELRDEAMQTLTYMEKESNKGFEDVFITKVDIAAKFDYCTSEPYDLVHDSQNVHKDSRFNNYAKDNEVLNDSIKVQSQERKKMKDINIGGDLRDSARPLHESISKRLSLSFDAEADVSKLCSDQELWRIYEEKVHSVLVQGLTDRAKFIRVIWRSTPSNWSIEDGLRSFGKEPVVVGVKISSPEKAFRLKDIGPNPENKDEVTTYKKLWGTKVETRRFLDGTIAESVVWEFREWETHLIIKAIVEHILSLHLTVAKEKIVVVSDQLDFCLVDGIKDPISFTGDITKAFDILSNRLRNLGNIPLRISSVQPLDSASRRTSVFPPGPHPLACGKDGRIGMKSHLASCVQSMEVMIQLEGSGNWPLDNIAVEKTKLAFLLKIGESLEKQWGMSCVASEGEVNVLLSGYAFHLRILHEKDGSLLKQGVSGQIRNSISVDNDLLLRSCHSSMLNGLQGRYPMYGHIVRLAKRWVASHLFSNFLREEAVELLVAYLFLKPFPFNPPCSRVTGFLRFLRLLSEYDWTNTPLVIDINGDLTSTDEAEINDNFSQSRKHSESDSDTERSEMFLATKYDKKSEAWTKYNPCLKVLKRISAYARSTENFLTDLIIQGESDQKRWESLFRTPLKNYDAVILLHEDKLAHPQRLLFSSDLNLGGIPLVKGNSSKDFSPYIPMKELRGNLQEVKRKLMVNFDPTTCFIHDLKQEFSGIFNLWYDAVGGDVIGLTWDKPLKRRKTEGGGSAAVGLEPIKLLRSVGDVGKGLVKSIHLLKTPRTG